VYCVGGSEGYMDVAFFKQISYYSYQGAVVRECYLFLSSFVLFFRLLGGFFLLLGC
jgi:hypothetical protein